MGQNILVIEDENHIVELIRFNLQEKGYTVSAARDGEKGLQMALQKKPNLILLDLMLPGMSGIDVCKTLKQNDKTHDIPVIMISAKSEESDIVIGLELGADDYVTKPFSPKQLMARVKAVLRRYQSKPKDRIVKIGELQLDTARHLVSLRGKSIDLTSKEYGLLRLLAESNGRVLSREQILESLWGHDESLNVEIRAVDKHIGELRKKIQSEADRIVTIKNFGYRFDVDDLEDFESSSS